MMSILVWYALPECMPDASNTNLMVVLLSTISQFLLEDFNSKFKMFTECGESFLFSVFPSRLGHFFLRHWGTLCVRKWDRVAIMSYFGILVEFAGRMCCFCIFNSLCRMVEWRKLPKTDQKHRTLSKISSS